MINVKNTLLTFGLLASLVSCNDAEVTPAQPQTPVMPASSSSSSSEPTVELPPVVVPPVTVPAVDEELALIQSVVDDENQYREVVGQLPLAKGLQCVLYTVTPGQQTIAGATLVQKATWGFTGVFNQPNSAASDGLNIIPPALRAQYTNWYKVTCSGLLAIPESMYLDLETKSDDNLIVTLDGVKIVNLDFNHGEQTAVGSKLVRKGMRSFKVEYLQANGSQSLIINKDGSPLSAKYFYR